jgi:4-amino-4-deoxy-L-arabinose transferase-like glycosyltransferase
MIEAAWRGVEAQPLAPVRTVQPSLAARAILPGIILFAAIFLYWDAASVPIRLWDESRNVVNALEMRASGWSLVTSYNLKPDLWNSKPPLLIWLVNASLAVFGPEPWAFRLPTMAAALGVLLLTIHFARRYTGSLAVGIGAAAVLLLSPGFYGAHGARTADYDMLLTLFTTAYLLVLFPIIAGRPTRGTAFAAGLLIAGAVLTKSSAGLLPGAGLLLYLLATGRLGRMLCDKHSWLIAASAIGPVMLFYLSREAAAPGYLQAVLDNEVSGRLGRTLIGRYEPWYFYVRDMARGWFFAAPLAVVAPLGWRQVRGKSRALMIYCLCVAGGLLLVISLAATKLPHYALPAYPPLAIAAALLLRGAWQRCRVSAQTATQRILLSALAAMLLGLPAARAVYWRTTSQIATDRPAASRYGDVFASLYDQGHRSVSVLDAGVRLKAQPSYTPVLRAYQLIWAERGMVIVRGQGGRLLASCDPRVVPVLLKLGSDLGGVEGCAAVAR